MKAREDQQRHAVGLGGEDLHASQPERHRPPRRARARAAGRRSEKPIAAASVSMWPASESSASECATIRRRARRAINATIRTSAHVRRAAVAVAGGRVQMPVMVVGHGLHDTCGASARAGRALSLRVRPGSRLQRWIPPRASRRRHACNGGPRCVSIAAAAVLVALKLGVGPRDGKPRPGLGRDRVQRRRDRRRADVLRCPARRPPGRPRAPLRAPPGGEPRRARRGGDPARRGRSS